MHWISLTTSRRRLTNLNSTETVTLEAVSIRPDRDNGCTVVLVQGPCRRVSWTSHLINCRCSDSSLCSWVYILFFPVKSLQNKGFGGKFSFFRGRFYEILHLSGDFRGTFAMRNQLSAISPRGNKEFLGGIHPCVCFTGLPCTAGLTVLKTVIQNNFQMSS